MDKMDKNKSIQRLPELDALRGIAALVVVLYHYLHRYIELYMPDTEPSELVSFGKYGVHLFFSISGFVIYWSVQRSKMGADFIIARVARLYPAYLTAVLFTFVIVSSFDLPGREVEISTAIKNILIFHSFLGIRSVDGVYWTLSYEVVFYSWIFFICTYLNKCKLLEIFSVMYVASAVIISFFSVGLVNSIVEKLFLYKYLPFFLIGIYFFNYYSNKRVDLVKTISIFIVILVAIYISKISPYTYIVIFCVFALLMFKKLHFLNISPLLYLGAISYSLYLVHQNFGYVIINYLVSIGFSLYWSAAMALMLSVGVSHVIYKLVEVPMKKSILNVYQRIRIYLLGKNSLEKSV